MQYTIERESNWKRYGFTEADEGGDAYCKTAVSAHEAVLAEQIERWHYLTDDGVTDELAARCIADGEPDRDVWMARDENGVVWRVIIHNVPVAINIFADIGERVSWAHSVAGVEVVR